MMFARIVVAVCTVLLLPSAFAARFEAPYMVEVPVASQLSADRAQASAQALALLLERLTGQAVAGNSRVSEAGKQAERYIAQFSYTTIPQQDAAAALQLRISFSPAQIDALLREAGLTLWPLDRPRVLLWLADDSGQPFSLPLAAATEQNAVVQSMGRQRGLPLQLPALDSVEREMLAQAPDGAAAAASLSSYPADAWLIGNFSGSDQSGWRLRWLLHTGGQDQRFDSNGSTLVAALDKALQETAARLSATYRASTASDTGPLPLRLQVEGIDNFAVYQRVRDFLQQLEVADRVAIVQVSGNTLWADVDARGRESLRAVLALQKALQWQEEVAPAPGSDPAVRTVWRYRWQEQ